MATTLLSNLMAFKVLFSVLSNDSIEGPNSEVKQRKEGKLMLSGIMASHAFCSEPFVFLLS